MEKHAQVESHAKNADMLAAAIFLKSKSYGHYESFLQRELAKVERKMRQEYNFVAKTAFAAEEDAFKTAYEANRKAFFEHVQAMSMAAQSASNEAASSFDGGWTPPSYEEMKALADKHAKAFTEKYAHSKVSDDASLLHDIADQAGGVKIILHTVAASDAQSTMKPKVTFVGKDGSLEGTIRSVPAPGGTFVQHFPSDDSLGKIQKVVISPDGADKEWQCLGFTIRSGGRDQQSMRFAPSSLQSEQHFWVKSADGDLELFPIEQEESDDVPSCSGFKGTMQCSAQADAARDRDADRSCMDEIDSSMSGYCQCESGILGRVDCGHDTFTCEEMCAIAIA